MDRGTLKTSAIFIATTEKTAVYRTLEEIPAALRKKLAKSTAGSNCATVVIADQRGAEELSRQGELRVLGRRGASPSRTPWRFGLQFMLEHWAAMLGSCVLAVVVWLLLFR